MQKRIKVKRICPICNKESLIRKDSFGKYCRHCRARENSKTKTFIDLTNKKFGKLTAIEVSHKKSSLYYWICICECGSKVTINGSRLRIGKTKSCGCLSSTQNGKSGTKTYHTWRAMIQRCYDKNVAHFKRYGGAGIAVCSRWLNSYADFLSDMGERPEGVTLDRVDPDGDYELSNCRWSTHIDQANNKKLTKYFIAFGKKMSLTQWSREVDIKFATLRKRIVELSWSIEEALTKKVRIKNGMHLQKKR